MAQSPSTFVIIGLGKFGLVLGEHLVNLGKKVIGLDSEENSIRRARDLLTQVYEVDATDSEALRQLGVQEMDCAVVSVGQSMEASILISLHLKELKVPRVLVKAMSNDHEKILHRLGVDEVIFPEHFAAEECARKLVTPGLLDLLPMAPGVVLQELDVEKWDGKTLRDIDLTNRFGVQVVAIKKAGETAYQFVPRADRPLNHGDVLVVIGDEKKIADID